IRDRRHARDLPWIAPTSSALYSTDSASTVRQMHRPLLPPPCSFFGSIQFCGNERTGSGEVEIADVRFPADQLLVVRPGDPIRVGTSGPSAGPFHAGRLRDHGRAATHLVELRLLAPGPP